MAEEPLDRLLLRRITSRGVVSNIFTAMESIRANMEQNLHKHRRLGILMDQLAKRTEVLKALDEKILQAIDLNEMEPEILSAEQFLSNIYIRRAVFQADYDSLKPPLTQRDDSSSSTSAGFRLLQRSSTSPKPSHSPFKTVATLFSSGSLQAGEESSSDEGCQMPFIANQSFKTIDLPVVEHDQVHLFFPAGAATAPHPQAISVTKLDGDQATVPDLAVHIIINSTPHYPTVEAVAAAAHRKLQLAVGTYNNQHVCSARVHQLARRILNIGSIQMEVDPALHRHPYRYVAARPIKPPPWLRRG